MKRVFLTSEQSVRDLACVNDNVAGAYIMAALQEAQDIKLNSIFGPALMGKLKGIVAAGETETEENMWYKLLLDQAKYYLAYQTAAELTYKVTYKITNFGVVRSTDENLSVPSFDDVAQVRAYYQAKADYYCIELQNFAYNNRSRYPELDANCCSRIKANLYSAASCGIWLGGVRGK